jgi:hypothetical protein
MDRNCVRWGHSGLWRQFDVLTFLIRNQIIALVRAVIFIARGQPTLTLLHHLLYSRRIVWQAHPGACIAAQCDVHVTELQLARARTRMTRLSTCHFGQVRRAAV